MDTFRIVVISDTHKDFLSLRKIAERHIQNADLFIHLGDLEEDVKKLKALYPNLPVRQVRGNCDFGSKLKTVDTVEVGGVKIFFCHGHTMMVGAGTGLLEQAARPPIRQTMEAANKKLAQERQGQERPAPALEHDGR